MQIFGLQKLSLLDFPEKTACTVFLGGCNFRCPFCQNGSLVLPGAGEPQMTEEAFFAFLKKRTGILDGVASPAASRRCTRICPRSPRKSAPRLRRQAGHQRLPP
ncbi:MAG: hypothetical protein ACLUE4_09905 [Acutalibacteraceae bacterium]